MHLAKPDKRIQAIYNLVPKCDIAADIGADHGKLSAMLLTNNVCKKMIISDISSPSLDKAIRIIRKLSLEDRADFITADGLDALQNNVDCVVIAGMGGDTISNILISGQKKLATAKLVLSANTRLELLRRTLYGIDYHCKSEILIEAGNRIYCIFEATHGSEKLNDEQYYIGSGIYNSEYDVSLKYLLAKKRLIETALQGIQNSVNNNKELLFGHKQHLAWIKAAIIKIQETKGSK